MHSWSGWETVKEATCQKSGVKERACLYCEETERESIPATGHTGVIDWVKTAQTHKKAYDCCGDVVMEEEEHNWNGAKCLTCGFDPTIAMSTVTVSAGEEAVMRVALGDNPGIIGLEVTVYYDESIFTLTNAENGNALKDLSYLPSGELASGSKFLWDGVEIDASQVKNGEFLALTFLTASNTPKGTYTISMQVNAYDENLKPLAFGIINGTVIVE